MGQKAADLQNVDSAYDPCRTAAVLRVGQSQPADRGGAIDNAVVRLIKQAAIGRRLSGHSQRAGLATAAGDAAPGSVELMRQTRHRSTDVVPDDLLPADLRRNNVTEK